MAEPDRGPRTLAARALLTRFPAGRNTMRGVAVNELGKLLVRIEAEAAAIYRTDLAWALDQLEQANAANGGLATDQRERIAAIRQLLDEAG